MARLTASGRIPLTDERTWYLVVAGKANTANTLLANYPAFDHATEDFSFAFWLRTKDTAGALFRHFSGANPGYSSEITGGTVKFELKTVTNATCTSTAKVNDGKWHHIALVNARQADGKLYVYIDGALAATSAAIADKTTSVTYNTTLLFSSSSNPLSANLTDIRHYTKALSASECASLTAGDHVSGSLTNWYPCQELEDNNANYDGSTPYIHDHMGTTNLSLKASGSISQQHDRLKRTAFDDAVLLCLGWITDVHHTAGASRTANLQACITAMNGYPLDAILCGGDMIDGVSSGQDATDIGAVNTVLSSAVAPRWTSLGSHDHSYISAGPGANSVSATLQGLDPGQANAALKSPYWSYDCKGIHIVALCADASDGTQGYVMGATQLAWLAADLAANKSKPTIILSHYRLDQDYPGNPAKWTIEPYSVFWTNAGAIRAILEAAGNVKLVLSGHEHGNHYGEVNGIRYIDQAPVYDGVNYSVLTVYSNYEVSQLGFGVVPSIPRR